MADQISGLLSPFLREQRFKPAKPHIRGKTLDYGCGIGLLSKILPRENYTGVDVDAESIAIARRCHPDRTFFTLDEFGEEGPYDTIVCLAVIEHLASPVDLLCRFKMLLAPSGRIVLTTPNPAFEWTHKLGAAVGLFSREGSEEHESLLNKNAIYRLAGETGLQVVCFRRFLCGANQLVILEHGK